MGSRQRMSVLRLEPPWLLDYLYAITRAKRPAYRAHGDRFAPVVFAYGGLWQRVRSGFMAVNYRGVLFMRTVFRPALRRGNYEIVFRYHSRKNKSLLVL